MRASFVSATQLILAALMIFPRFGFSQKAIGAPTTQQCVDRLAAADPVDREAAESQLQKAGPAALAGLSAASSDSRPEVRDRAHRLLARLQLSMLPDQDHRVLEIANQCISATNSDQRKSLLNQLLVMEPQTDAVLARIAALEMDEDARHLILYRLLTRYRDSVGRWLAVDHDQLGVLQLLNGASAMWGQGASADYAVALQTAGQLDQQIQICRAEQANGDSDEAMRAARQLCFFYRVQGKWDLALQAAREAREPSLVFLVLNDQGDWQTAADEPDDRWHDALISSSIRAGYQRLAGQSQKAISTMTGLVPNVNADADDNCVPSKFFLLNDLPERGMELMVGRHPTAVFSMHVARGEISQAFEIAKKYAQHPVEGPALLRLRDDLWRTLGEMPELVTGDKKTADNPSDGAWKNAVIDLTQQRYQNAAEAFGAMWKADPSRYDCLYLQGYALKSAGDVQQGESLMRTATMVPLGDPLRRYDFASQLEMAGLTGIAQGQRQLGMRTGSDFDEIGFSAIQDNIYVNAYEHKRWAVAADAVDRLCLISLAPRLQWKNSELFFTFPAQAHLVKSFRDRERGDLTAALRELQAYQEYLPASSEMVLDWVPALDEMGKHEKADALFNGVFDKLNAICEKYPKSVAYQNQIAWMCACCDRKLDRALARAEATVKLKPGNWQTMDTLAEIHFRRGEREAAIDLEKQAAALSGDPYLTRQLNRFEKDPIPSTTQPGVAPE